MIPKKLKLRKDAGDLDDCIFLEQLANAPRSLKVEEVKQGIMRFTGWPPEVVGAIHPREMPALVEILTEAVIGVKEEAVNPTIANHLGDGPTGQAPAPSGP